MNIVVLGLSITSSWGNGHATTYRALGRALSDRGHRIHFLERDVEWYASNRDQPESPYWQTTVYDSLERLRQHTPEIRSADVVIVGSYVPQGDAVIDWVLEEAKGVRAFYDIDTPVTLEKLRAGTCEYLRPDQVPQFDVYLSFSGGRILRTLEREQGARRARPLYCAVDPERYAPSGSHKQWHLGYLGTYSADRQPALDARLLEPARRWPRGRFVVAGPQFPRDLEWPPNVERITHLSPREHPSFYGAQRFTLNVTRTAMIDAGHSPSVRLFEAAACGTPIITDEWPGLEEFFKPSRDILVTRSAEETLAYVRGIPERERCALAQRARARVLGAHTAAHRAEEFEGYVAEARADR
jgi:spore maturation protein CgeB